MTGEPMDFLLRQQQEINRYQSLANDFHARQNSLEEALARQNMAARENFMLRGLGGELALTGLSMTLGNYTPPPPPPEPKPMDWTPLKNLCRHFLWLSFGAAWATAWYWFAISV